MKFERGAILLGKSDLISQHVKAQKKVASGWEDSSEEGVEQNTTEKVYMTKLEDE